MQMAMFDPRQTPTATAAMLADKRLRRAIATMRKHSRINDSGWPYVEDLGAFRSSHAWVVDDHDVRYVVVGDMIFDECDLKILNCKTREAACAVFARLDAGVAA